MIPSFALFGLTLATALPPGDAPGHDANPVVNDLRGGKVSLGGVRIKLPEPLLPDDLSNDGERKMLHDLAGTDRGVTELVRDSVTAPQVLRTHDQAAGKKGVVRFADLYFVVHARLDAIDPDSADFTAAEGKTVEAGNMKFTAERLGAKALAGRGVKPAGDDAGVREWYVHATGRLLGRIHVEATDRIVATQTGRSWLIASRTDPRFEGDGPAPNRWHPVTRKGGREEAGPDEAYPGGASYVKITTLNSVPGALFVEAHAAFFEPAAWFDGAPVLRSKIGVVAQDRVRGLRRELEKSRKRQGARKASDPSGG